MPTTAFPGLSIGPPTNQPNIFFQDTYQVRGDLTWFAGAHTFKTGGEFLRVHDTGLLVGGWGGPVRLQFAPADLGRRFPANAWNNPAAWDLTGLDSFVQRLDINFRDNWDVDMPRPTVGVWIGDDWRLNDRLTMNFGVRWDADFGVADPPGIPETTILIDNGRVSGDFGYKTGHTDARQLAPRGGFVYRVGAARTS